MDVNQELKFFGKFKKTRIDVYETSFCENSKKKIFFWGGGGGSGGLVGGGGSGEGSGWM